MTTPPPDDTGHESAVEAITAHGLRDVLHPATLSAVGGPFTANATSKKRRYVGYERSAKATTNAWSHRDPSR